MMQKSDRLVAFVCTGNTCRSPMAQAIFNKLASEKGLDVRALSFGLAAVEGMRASVNSTKVCEEIGIDLSDFRTHFIYSYDIGQFEKFYCMSEGHRTILINCGIEPERVVSMDVPDPFGGDLNIYRLCRDSIYNSVEEIIKEYENTENDA